MRQPPFTGIPLRNLLHIWIGCIDGLYGSLLPLLLFLCGHALTLYGLHQSMHRKQGGCLTACLSMEQGIGTQCLDGLIEEVGVSSHSSKLRAKMFGTFCDDRFRNGIRGQECAES